MQLLGADDEQAMLTNRSVQGMIQEYGQSLTSSDPRLALEYYWQAAAVVGGSISVKVRQHFNMLALLDTLTLQLYPLSRLCWLRSTTVLQPLHA